MKNSNVNINVVPQAGDKSPWYTKFFKWYVSSITEASFLHILKVFVVTFFFLALGLAGIYTYNVVSNKEVVQKSVEYRLSDKQKEGIRDIVTPKIQHDIEILLYSLNADRVFIFEMHNGQENLSGLPFPFANMSYEEVNVSRNVDKVYHKYKDVPLTQYKFPEYLRVNKVMIGTMEEISKIDYDFAKRAKEDGGEYMAVQYLSVNGKPLAFVGISFHKMSYAPSNEFIEEKFKIYGPMLTELLDLKKQAEKMEGGK